MDSSRPLPSVPLLDEAARTVTVRFRGASARIVQEHRLRGPEGEDNTGWQVWECSNVALRYVGDDGNLAALLRTDDGAPVASSLSSPCPTSFAGFASTRFLDLSAGAGLIALALAAAGAPAWASDIPTQLPQLRDNIARNGLGGAAPLPQQQQHGGRERGDDDAAAAAAASNAPSSASSSSSSFSSSSSSSSAAAAAAPSPPSSIGVLPYWWGEDVASLSPDRAESSDAPPSSTPPPLPWYDVCIASDIVYIALRDGRARELSTTLRALVRVCRAVLFAFEERLIREEDAFVASLSEPGPDGEGDAVDVHEIKGAWTVLSKEEALQGVGGRRDTETGDMFWEPPPIRMVVLRQARGET